MYPQVHTRGHCSAGALLSQTDLPCDRRPRHNRTCRFVETAVLTLDQHTAVRVNGHNGPHVQALRPRRYRASSCRHIVRRTSNAASVLTRQPWLVNARGARVKSSHSLTCLSGRCVWKLLPQPVAWSSAWLSTLHLLTVGDGILVCVVPVLTCTMPSEMMKVA